MDEVLTVEQAAEYLKFAKVTLNKFRVYGGGPRFAKISGRAVRYRRADLDAWLEGKLVNSTSEAA